MFPTPTLSNFAYSGLTDTEFYCQPLQGPSIAAENSHSDHVLIGELRGPMFISTRRLDAKDSEHVDRIFAMSDILQIFHVIVVFISVFVIDLLIQRSGANEGCSYETMDRELLFIAVPKENRSNISPLLIEGKKSPYPILPSIRPPSDPANSAKIAHIIYSCIPRYWLPKFVFHCISIPSGMVYV